MRNDKPATKGETMATKRNYRKLISDGYVVYHRGVHVVVKKTGIKTTGNQWLAVAMKRDGIEFVDSWHLVSMYDHASTRKEAVENVIRCIDDEAERLESFRDFLTWLQLKEAKLQQIKS